MILGILRSMKVTLKHFFKRSYTANYPIQKLEMPERFRGVLSLVGMVGELGDQPKPEKLAPCTNGCPAHVNARGYINLTALGKYYDGYLLHLESNPMPATFGRICSHPCETVCRRGVEDEPISIRGIKRFMADQAIEDIISGARPNPHKPHESPNGIKVAIVGSGPAGLSCAYYLAKRGYSPVIFEKEDEPGGMLVHGIPVHRLPREILTQEIDFIKDNGVEIRTGVGMGEAVSIEGLLDEGYKAFFVSAGLSYSKMLPLEGKDLKGIYSATEVLQRINDGEELELGKNLIVIGAGNVAMDVTQCLCRLGKNVSVACRATRDKLAAYPEEIEDAEMVGADFNYKIEPSRYIGKEGKVTGVQFKPVYRGPDKKETTRPAEVPTGPGSTIALEAPAEAPAKTPDEAEVEATEMTCDGVIVAIGQFAEIGFLAEAGVQFTPRGLVQADPITCQTSVPFIFAGGDVVTGPSSAINGIGNGHMAAISIDAYLNNDNMPTKEYEPPREAFTKHKFNWMRRFEAPEIDLKMRSTTFEEVELGYSEEIAIKESERCLSCSSNKCVGCQICELNCPDKCIYIAAKENGDPKGRDIYQFDIEISACSFCGICSEACPTKCLRHTTNYGFSTDTKRDLVFNKPHLLELGKEARER